MVLALILPSTTTSSREVTMMSPVSTNLKYADCPAAILNSLKIRNMRPSKNATWSGSTRSLGRGSVPVPATISRGMVDSISPGPVSKVSERNAVMCIPRRPGPPLPDGATGRGSQQLSGGGSDVSGDSGDLRVDLRGGEAARSGRRGVALLDLAELDGEVLAGVVQSDKLGAGGGGGDAHVTSFQAI